MPQPKSLPNTAHKSGPLLSGPEEAARFTQATDRFLERARQDPKVAEKFLRDSGYYEIMKGQNAQDGQLAKGTSVRKSSAQKASTRKVAASKTSASPASARRQKK